MTASCTICYEMADGVKLAADIGGNPDSATVVLMHGGGQTRHSWAGAMNALISAGYFVINYDSRGHGESDWAPSGDYTLPTRAADLLKILQDRSPPIALVGASLGGATAMQAIADGFRPAALVLVDIVPRPDPRGVARIRNFMLAHPDGFATVDEAADAIAAYNPHRPRATDPNGLMKNLRLRADGRLYWHWDPRILERGPEQDLAEFLHTVEGLKRAQDIPVQLVRGLLSDIVGDQGITELQSVLPGLEVFDVAGAGHMVAGDRNDVFNKGIMDFLMRTLPCPDPRAS